MGRQFISSALLMLYVQHSLKNRTSGGEDFDPSQERALRTAGKKSGQVYFGNVGIPVGTLQTHHLMFKIVNLIMIMHTKWVLNGLMSQQSKVVGGVGWCDYRYSYANADRTI